MVSAIIVAAGKGTRMGAQVDKLWLEVAGRPVVAHTWKKFNDAAAVDEIILVIREGMQPHFTALAEQFHFQKRFRLVAGGRGAAGFSLERIGSGFARHGNCRHPGCRPALHGGGIDCGHHRRRARNRRRRRGATGDRYHQGNR